jgi:hypothetical protein
VVALEETLLLRTEAERVASGVEDVDAAKQAVIEIDRAVMLGQNGRDLALDGLQGVIRIRAGQIEKGGRDAAEQSSASLKRDDRVLERRIRGVLRDGLHLATIFGHRGIERTAKTRPVDTVKWRRLERRRPGLEQRVASHEGLAELAFRLARPAFGRQQGRTDRSGASPRAFS